MQKIRVPFAKRNPGDPMKVWSGFAMKAFAWRTQRPCKKSKLDLARTQNAERTQNEVLDGLQGVLQSRKFQYNGILDRLFSGYGIARSTRSAGHFISRLRQPASIVSNLVLSRQVLVRDAQIVKTQTMEGILRGLFVFSGSQEYSEEGALIPLSEEGRAGRRRSRGRLELLDSALTPGDHALE